MLKAPINIPQQLEQFRKHGIVVQNADFAAAVLEQVSYYKLSGYSLEFRIASHSSQYAYGTSFDHIYAIYRFDQELRQILRKYLETAEIFYKTHIANTFSLLKCNQPPHNQHYDEANYYRKQYFREFISHINKDLRHYKDSPFVKHHVLKYHGKMPLWALTEIMTFSDLSKYYSCLYISDQEAIASSVNTQARILRNHLHCMAILRNKCSHAARLYNTILNPKVTLPAKLLRAFPDLRTDTVFSYILMLECRLPDIFIKNYYKDSVIDLFDKYKADLDFARLGIPDAGNQDWKTILQQFSF